MATLSSLDVPSGRTFNRTDLTVLTFMNEFGFIRYSEEPFKLKSGIMSHVYVYGRNDLTDHPKLAWNIGMKICHQFQAMPDDDLRQVCLIGVPMAGLALASAASLISFYISPNQQIAYRMMRSVKKSHGAHQSWIDGKPALDECAYWLIDNVATDGESKFEADQKATEDGYPPRLPCLILVDRQQGAVNRLQQAGFRVEVIYNLLDITFAFGELGLWPKETVKLVELEIQAHQESA